MVFRRCLGWSMHERPLERTDLLLRRRAGRLLAWRVSRSPLDGEGGINASQSSGTRSEWYTVQCTKRTPGQSKDRRASRKDTGLDAAGSFFAWGRPQAWFGY